MKKLVLSSVLLTGLYFTALSQECEPVNLPYLEDLAINENSILPDCVTTNATTFTPNIWQVRDGVPGFNNSLFVFYTGNEMDEIGLGADLHLRELNLEAGMTYRISYKCQNSVDQFEIFQLYADIRMPVTAPVYSEATMLFDTELTTVSDEFTVSVTGTYFFSFGIMTMSNVGEIYLDDILIEEVGPTMGIDAVTATTFELYPNPAKDLTTIKHTNVIDAIQLYNSTGQLLKAEAPNALQTQIDLSAYSSGIYFVSIESMGNITHKKIIKE